jgi:hypothetical protein
LPLGASAKRMNELLVGYALVSTEQQDLAAQRNGLRALGVGDDRSAVRYAVEGAAHALIPDPDVLLRRMLVESIDICAAWTGNRASGVGVDEAAWAEACRLTVAGDGG